ncbi:MAG: efflux RND transporter permease subunit, partial [Anaerolineae bacterium]
GQQPAAVLTVPEGMSIADIAAGLGVSTAALRRANDLAPGQGIPAGATVTVPVEMVPPLADEWNSLYGVASAGEISDDIMVRALEDTPDLVMGLEALQLVALPVESFQQLPVSLLVQLPEPLRLLLLSRGASPGPRGVVTRGARGVGRATASATPRRRATRRPTRAPTRRPTAVPTVTVAPTPRPSPTPGPITLGDVAKVEVAPAKLTILNRTDGEASLGLIVAKESQANTVAVADRVDERLDDLLGRRDMAGLRVTKVFEQAPFVRESINGVVREGLLGGLFAVLVIFMFLNRSVRSTIIVALSIPLSVFVGTLLMRVQGLTLNMITLGGITVAIGRVVDDAIVVLENVYRHLQRGERRLDSVLVGTSEVATAITASTLVAVAVFLPLGLVGGLTRQFFLPMALTITYALLASLGVATTVVPTLARSFLSHRSLPEDRETWLQRLYSPVLEWCLGHRLATLLVAIVFFVASLGLARIIPVTFLPGFGPPSVTVTLSLPPGTRLETTDEAASSVEEILMNRDDVETVQTTVGVANPFAAFFGMASGNQSAAAFLQAALVEDFDGDVNGVAAEIRGDLAALDTSSPMTATVRSGEAGGPEGGGFDLLLKSDSEADLRTASAMALEALGDPDNWKTQDDKDSNRLAKALGGSTKFDEVPFVNLESNLSASQRILAVEVDPEAALGRGLTTVQVALALREALEEQDLGTVELIAEGDAASTDSDGQPVRQSLSVVARYPADTVDSLDGLSDFVVAGPAGPVRLGDIAAITEAPGPVQITRVDGSRAAIITADILEEDTIRVQQRGQEIVEGLPELPDSVDVTAGSNSASQQEAFKDMFAALGVAVVIAYFVLVVTFGSLVHPFTVLFSLPFALSGALIALAATGRVLSVSSLIGLLMLIGIVLANAIVLIDLVQQYRQRGMSAHEALMRGGRVRLRPILMTATATVLALIPLALGLTEGAIIAAELATVVIGGLITSTILTLIIVPVIYSLLDRLAHPRSPAAGS